MQLLLIRHGETVDNVANVFAGSRDSALTTHGVLQARRLAAHLSQHVPASARIFSSNLQRAVKTAEAIRDALGQRGEVQQLASLREKHYGGGEGTRFGSSKEKPHEGAESVQSMRARVDEFLDGHLLPLLKPCGDDATVVVAHGIILGVLFERLCERLGRSSMSIASEAQGPRSLSSGSPSELLSWSNTGYLDAILTPTAQQSWTSTNLDVHRVNCIDHLQGLRKTRGGIGSARFDEKQQTMDSFFTRKRKLADAAD